jgi:rare lipoprotein A
MVRIALSHRSTVGGVAIISALLGFAGQGELRAEPAGKPPPPQTGVASYYGPEFAGKRTASGEPHNPRDLTAASRSLPLGTKAKVTNAQTGKSVVVEVNDRGPYAKGRILDVSPRAAEQLGMKEEGVANVRVQPLTAGEAKK